MDFAYLSITRHVVLSGTHTAHDHAPLTTVPRLHRRELSDLQKMV